MVEENETFFSITVHEFVCRSAGVCHCMLVEDRENIRYFWSLPFNLLRQGLLFAPAFTRLVNPRTYRYSVSTFYLTVEAFI